MSGIKWLHWLPMRKDELRRRVRLLKQQFTPEQLAVQSLPILGRLRPRLEDAQVVLAYYSLPDEVDTHRLIDELVAKGKTVLLPKVLDGESMELRRYCSRDDLREGPFGIMEPVGEPYVDYECIDIALIPGMAFDGRGHRLGRGRGYYDRLLTAHRSVPTIGVCFDFQKVAEVPVDSHDRAVDAVV